MSEFSDEVLKRGYIIYISKKRGQHKLQGTYLKFLQNGFETHELSEKELQTLIHLPYIMEELDQGALLQVHQSGYQINGVIGKEKTEGPYCEREYLEVIATKEAFSYYEMLVNLEVQLEVSKNNKGYNVIQYTKLYKGVDRYE